MRRRFDLLPLGGAEPRGGDDDGHPELHASLQYRHGPFRLRKIDEHIESQSRRQVLPENHADGAESAHFAHVASLVRMPRHVQGRSEGQFRILVDQVNQSLSHAAAGPMNSKDGGFYH